MRCCWRPALTDGSACGLWIGWKKSVIYWIGWRFLLPSIMGYNPYLLNTTSFTWVFFHLLLLYICNKVVGFRPRFRMKRQREFRFWNPRKNSLFFEWEYTFNIFYFQLDLCDSSQKLNFFHKNKQINICIYMFFNYIFLILIQYNWTHFNSPWKLTVFVLQDDSPPPSLAAFCPADPSLLVYTGYGVEKELSFYSLTQKQVPQQLPHVWILSAPTKYVLCLALRLCFSADNQKDCTTSLGLMLFSGL